MMNTLRELNLPKIMSKMKKAKTMWSTANTPF